MQDRYTGDIGDYVKYGLLRALSKGRSLGLAWYLYPDEAHNDDGRHIQYLSQPGEWRASDPDLYDSLNDIVSDGVRSVRAIEQSALMPGTTYSSELLDTTLKKPADRAVWRGEWFSRVCADLANCDVVFADPDNGLCDDEKFSPSRRTDWKRLPLDEVKQLSTGRVGVFYHHNSRFPGGHLKEIEHWMDRLPGCRHALYWRRFSNRTFFVVDADVAISAILQEFCDRWGHGVELICR